jgi:hypothetical protein
LQNKIGLAETAILDFFIGAIALPWIKEIIDIFAYKGDQTDSLA